MCSVDRVSTIHCSMQLTAAWFRHQFHPGGIVAPQIDVHRRVRDSSVTAGVKFILQDIPKKVFHFIIHTEFSSDWTSKPDFSTLRWFMTVLSYPKHALTLNQKRFRQIDNEQHNFHTDPCSGYVRILYHYQLSVTWFFDCHVDCQIHQRNHLNLFFQLVSFQLKVDQRYPIFHWSWNFWEMFSLISFVKNFFRMKRWWREELQLPATIRRSFVTSYKWKNLFGRYR